MTPTLEAAGHDVRPITLPGLESRDADRSSITLSDHVAAVVAEIDAASEPVVLVGHSGAGAVVHAAADQRPDAVARVVYVDSGPMPAGGTTNDALPVVDGEIPLPDWETFNADGPNNLRDFSDEQLEAFRSRAIAMPAGPAQDEQVLSDDRRYSVPITLIATTFTREEIDGAVAAGVPFFAELPRISDVSIVELPTSHWPQFTQPTGLAQAIVDAV